VSAGAGDDVTVQGHVVANLLGEEVDHACGLFKVSGFWGNLTNQAFR
jgi:hypothetical protein